MRTRKLSRLTQTAIGPKTVGFENIVQQAQQSIILSSRATTRDNNHLKPPPFFDLTCKYPYLRVLHALHG